MAPLEGYHRPLGYRLLGEVQAVLESQPAIQLVALDDHLQPEPAADAARQLAIDPAVLAVIGPWSAETFRAALPVFEAEGLPVLAPIVLPDHPASRWAFHLGPTYEELARQAAAILTAAGARALHPIGGPLAGRLALVSGLPDAREPGEGAFAFLDLPADEAARWLREEGRDWPRTHILGGPGLDSEKLLQLAGPEAQGVRFLAPAGDPSPHQAQARRAAELFLQALEGGARGREGVRHYLASLTLEAPPLVVYEIAGLDYPAALRPR